MRRALRSDLSEGAPPARVLMGVALVAAPRALRRDAHPLYHRGLGQRPGAEAGAMRPQRGYDLRLFQRQLAVTRAPY